MLRAFRIGMQNGMVLQELFGMVWRFKFHFRIETKRIFQELLFVGLSQIKLKHNPQTVNFDSAWAEKAWYFSSNPICLLGGSKSIIPNEYRIIVPRLESDSINFHFLMYPVGLEVENGEDSRKRYNALTNFLPDTLRIKLVERDPRADIGWQRELEGDTLVFIKRK